MSAPGLNLLVFRDSRRRIRGTGLRSALMAQLESLSVSRLPSHVVLRALLRAGELECGAADAAHDASSPFPQLTDYLALALLGGAPDDIKTIRDSVARAPLPDWLNISAPEGFAYYALHPLAYAEALDQLSPLPEQVVIIGIRSIGTTLSAVTSAAARLRGSGVERLTVRPGGHPYDRRTIFSQRDLRIIQSGIHRRAQFLVVDEGPGLSGSSFLSVAEALEAARVERQKIVLLCGHEPNPEALCSANAAQRWRRYRRLPVTGEARKPAGAGVFAGAGEWRPLLLPSQSAWPAAWTSMERLKYISPGNGKMRRLFKFEGLGHYGEGVLERQQVLAAGGFAAPGREESDGFVSYPWLDGRPMTAASLSASVISRLAEYCAFRASAFRLPNAGLGPLQEMAEHDLRELGFDLPVMLELERPVIADSRMQPYEWILSPDGSLIKTDGASHGDDHFYPGPTDMAWDLAGAIVEWRMNQGQSAQLLRDYRRKSGDDARQRIGDFIRAYTAFRCAYCRMAANAMAGTPEQARLDRAAEAYSALLATEINGRARERQVTSSLSLPAASRP